MHFDKYPFDWVRGVFTFRVLEYDEDNNCVEIFLLEEEFNLIPDVARELTSKVTAGVAAFIVSQLAIGDGLHGGTILAPGDPSPSDTGLENQLFAKSIGSATHPLTTTTLYSTTVDRSEANDSPEPIYTEAALLATNNTPLALKTYPGQVKNLDREFIYDWTIAY